MDPSKHLYKSMEALVVLALEQLVPPRTVWWNPPQQVVPFDSDITIGPRPFLPEVVILVTHGGPQNGGQVKFWRDLHEFFLYRTARPATRIIRVLYGSANSPQWHRQMVRFYDGSLELDTLPASAQINQLLLLWTTEHFHAMDREAVKIFLSERCQHPPLAGFFSRLKQALFALLQAPMGDFLPKLPPRGLIMEPSFPTSVRRAVTLLGLFPELLRTSMSGKMRRSLTEAGILEESLTGFRPAFPYGHYITQSRDLLGTKLLTTLVKRAVPHLALIRRRWDHRDCLIESIQEACRTTRPEACAFSQFSEEEAMEVGGNPLLLGLRYVLKSRSLDSFGHGLLLREAGLPQDTASLYRLSRMFRGEIPLDPRLEDPLKTRLDQAKEIIESSRGTFKQSIFSVLFKDEAIKVRQVEPLLWLLQQGGPPRARLEPSFPSLVDPSGRAGTVRLLVSGSALAHWKTAHKGQRDKTKELAAKGFSLAAMHPEISRRYLFLDGEWSPKNLGILATSGWTHVYPISALGPVFMKKRFTKKSVWV
ncbi:hypothetical protein KKF84_10295 [Myxococcota bacterium]|nr:hypothetical protein [Myxococcota bacterium]MBU1535701.1 hypothetical protein [Myxococcota bacterium]